MAKKQIRINQSDIRRMIKEAVDSMGYPKVSGGAFSMDSPLGQEIKDHAQKYTRPGEDWLDREKWEDTWMSRDDGNDKRDRFAMDEFGDEKADSGRFDKPFGEFDDEIENQWDDEPGYADEPDDDEIAGIDEDRKIKLNEKQLREFVSYSVSRLLKEGYLEEAENRGIMTHFDGNSSFQPENPYEDMTWNEYCEAKRGEREEEDSKPEKEPNRTNRGIMTHFDGKGREETPEDKERDEHMFDDNYWANKMNLSKDELSEIVKRTVKRLTEEMNLGGEGEEVVDNFPKKAGVSFTEKYGQMDVKCKALVSISDAEVTIDILQYGPEGWEPEMEWMFSAEEYSDGAWLPYWETLGGDASMKTLARFWPKIMKALIKIGYLADEDDEIPFRFVGDIKVGNKRY